MNGQFEKGNPGGPGRPPGAKDKLWASLATWAEGLYAMAIDEKTPIAIRANIALHFFDALLARRKLPAETPEESAENALAAQNLLKKMEDDARSGRVRSD